MSHLPFLAAAWLLLVGLVGVATSRHLVSLVVCLMIAQSSTYLLLLSVGWRAAPAGPPIFDDVPPGTPTVDPVVQALALTDIVVGATVAALLLALVVEIHERCGTTDPRRLAPFRP